VFVTAAKNWTDSVSRGKRAALEEREVTVKVMLARLDHNLWHT
jgi:hypothetical protein